ncbi:putative cold-shock DEAD-box protein [Gordonia polyisoprenivorans VH2]|uniref:Putative cold-shock DEAD-box protein n=1 Tax=Gordonia polyisoprenivorans (strain DSM 44266 / VH2) TaxID=1112204 RepID=H6MZ54_GORPV|nr:DEAD/DEAH box helicase [Gordonia polyisoprenivorans]AFA74390.1 putative cold-shock DEAD-box protein [Gordonia polyisoprenivorans VH2]
MSTPELQTDEVQTTVVDEEHTSPTFADLGVDEHIVSALADDGKTRTFAIQELTLPLALGGSDLIGQARTGMGKTLGFGVPLLHRLVHPEQSGVRPLDNTPRALVIVPTRELCLQVTGDLEVAAKKLVVTLPSPDPVEGDDAPAAKPRRRPLKITSIYGGRPYESQIADLRAGVDVVVGTPGRLLDLAQQGHLILGKVAVLVLDEADEMLDLGFLPDIERIMATLPDQKQTMLFSATMPGPIVTLARTFLKQPTHIRAEHANDSAVHERTTQYVYRAHALDKAELVARILQAEGRGATMIFTRTKRAAQKVADDLAERGFSVGAVHGDLGQVAREKALKKFRTGEIDVLVATDVAARGIDIDDVTHVINYQCPEDDKTYVHRIGRTGRAGRTGIAVTLVDWDELHRWELINAALQLGVPEPAETYSTSEHLRDELSIPESATGRITAPRRSSADGEGERTERRERRERPTRSSRTRRRTRGGQAVDADGEQNTTADAATTADTDERPADSKGSADAESANDAGDAPRKRRRRRGGARRRGGQNAPATSDTGASE